MVFHGVNVSSLSGAFQVSGGSRAGRIFFTCPLTLFLPAQFREQPHPGVGPVTFRRGRGNPENFGGFIKPQAHVKPQLYQLRFFRGFRGKFFQRLIQSQEDFVGNRLRHVYGIKIDPLQRSSMPDPVSPPCAVNENTAHCFCSRSEKMPATLPVLAIHAGEFDPCFMDEGGGLEGELMRFLFQPCRCQPAQLLIDFRQQVFGGGPGCPV